ncbi:MAG: class I SAM-dependent methyltransferase, partial [Spirochaetes bacterium]|nr:class I SAM-dependent methyltransferase [Spirochaetota bacterium]
FSIDLSYGMVQQLTGILSAGHYKNVEVMQMDAEFLSFSDNSFDYIFCGFGIFFFPDLKKAVSEISRVLKENGIFGFTTFRELQEHKLLEPVFKKYFPVDPDDRVAQNKHLFDSEEGLEKFLKENDLKKLKIINEKKEFTYPSREKWWEKQFTHGMKRRIEKLDQSRVAEFKEDCFRELEKVKVTNGYRLFVDVFFTFAQK